MLQFRSWHSYHDFEVATRLHKRYVHPPEVADFLKTLADTAEERVETIPSQSNFWRAQLGHEVETCYEEGQVVGEIRHPLPSERMKPTRDVS